MAAIQTSLLIADRMTPALRAISSSMGIVIHTFEEMQAASNHAVNTDSLQAARRELGNVERTIQEVDGQIHNAANQQEHLNHRMREGHGAADSLAELKND